jgi:hypothetical protein
MAVLERQRQHCAAFRQGGGTMSRFENAVRNDIQALELLHDELRLQAHLFKAEASKRWEELEVKWTSLKDHLQRAQVEAGHSKDEISSAVQLLVDALKTGYADIRRALKS